MSIVYVLMAAFSGQSAAALVGLGIPVLPSHMSLVRGRVGSVEEARKGISLASVRVTSVDVGNQSLSGKVFHDVHSVNSLGEQFSHAPYRVGDCGVWVVEHSRGQDGSDIVRLAASDLFPVRYRLIGGKSSEEDTYRDFVLALNQYQEAGPQQKYMMLHDCVYSTNYFITAWSAIRISALHQSLNLYSNLHSAVTSGCMPIKSFIYTDNILSLRDDAWPNSNRRINVLNHYCSSLVNFDDQDLFQRYMSSCVASRKLGYLSSLRLIRSMALNSSASIAFRAAAIHSLQPILQDAVHTNECLEILLCVARDKNINIRKQSIQLISEYRLVKSYDSRLAIIFANETDSVLREMVQNIMMQNSK